MSLSTSSNPSFHPKLPYDTLRDFTPVTLLGATPFILVVHAAVPARSVQDLAGLARAKPGALNYGSFGVGSAAHLDAEKFGVAAGIQTTHIPYKGGSDVAKALLTGEIDFSFNGLSSVLGLIRQGQLKALAWGAPERSSAIPDVPTLKEVGYDFETGGWLGSFVPTGTPRAVIEKISGDTLRVINDPAFRARFVVGVGLEPMSMSATEFAAEVKQSRAAYVNLFSKISIKLQ